MKLFNHISIISQIFSIENLLNLIENLRKSSKKQSTIPTIAKLQTLKFNRKFLKYFYPTTTSVPIILNSFIKSWSFTNLNWNKLMHILMGNRKLGYRLGMWNCRKGLFLPNKLPSEKLTDIKNLLQQHDLHILGVVECDLHSVSSRVRRAQPLSTKDVIEKLHVEGYVIKLPLSWKVHGQARILLYVRENLNVKIRELSRQDSDLPSISCEIAIGREKKTCANFFYREWTGGVSGLGELNAQLERLSRLSKHWRSLYTGGRDVIILGDANLCAFNWNNSTFQFKSLALIIHDFLLETSSSQQVSKYTRSEKGCSGIVRSCIDHCYTDVPEKLSNLLVVSSGDSDHLAVIVTKFAKTPITKPQTVKKRSYKYFCAGSFLTDILNSGINEKVTTLKDMEEAAKVFEEQFSDILDFHAPVKTFQMRKNYLTQISQETKLLIAERKTLQEEAISTGNPVLQQDFKIKCKEVKKAVKKDEKEYLEKDFNENASIETAWRTARNMMGVNKNLSPTSILNEGEIISNPGKIAKTASIPEINPVERLQKWLGQKERLPKFSLQEINLNMLRKIIKKIKGKRSHGVDYIDSYSLKLAGPLIEDSLLHLVNLSITQKCFASNWKPQLIFPLHKKKSKSDVKNYRPVSHLVEVGKMVEYAVYYQVLEHFSTHRLFHPNHHGSLAGHSTATALMQLVDMWIEASENTELSAALLLDQSAAYDLVDHLLFLQKLQAYNFDDESVKWFSSYLSDRSQIVQVESKQSTPCSMEDHAVPQGSILGGLIFIIFSNDLPASSQDGESVMFVDYDTDVVHHANPVQLQEQIQIKADCSASWLRDNRMCVAGEKSKLLIIGTQKLRNQKLTAPMKIKVDNLEVVETKSEKLLGVVINNKLTWHDHLYGEKWRIGDENTPGLIPQLSQRVGILRRMSKLMNKKRLNSFTHGIFYSKMNYCLTVFGHVFGLETYSDTDSRYYSFTKEDNRKMQVLQNSVMRLLTGKERGTPTTTLIKLTKSLSVQQTIAFQTLLMVHKIVNSSKPVYLADRLKFKEDGRNQGVITNIDQRLSTSRGGFVYRGSMLFNKLPVELRVEPILKKFREAARTWVIKNVKAKPG